MKITGKVSHFGGPQDTGVSPSEDLAFWEDIKQVADPEELFLPSQPPNTTGLARRLDPNKLYVAVRWDYSVYPKSQLKSGELWALVRSPKTGKQLLARPADWGPNEATGRVADVSPAVLKQLGIQTDDTVEVIYPFGTEEAPMRIAISAGHGKYVKGAAGVQGYQENVETPKVMAGVAKALRARGVEVVEFWDQTSKTQDENLKAICSWHNKQTRDYDVSVHFNASNGQGHGVEVWYVTQKDLSARISKSMSEAGFTDRGAKYTSSLYFLNNTSKPAVLIETCFIDNNGDMVGIYMPDFNRVCELAAIGICGIKEPIQPPGPEPGPEPGPSPEPGPEPEVQVAMTIPEGVKLTLMVNGELVLLGDE